MTQRVSKLGAGLVWGLAAWLAASAYGQESKSPEWKHGLEFRVRKAGQPDFDKDTPRFGCEVYHDKNTNQAVYVCQTGALSVITAGTFASGSETKAPKWLHGLELKCRKDGETDFTNATKKFGIEVFRDENTGFLVYICESGALAVVKAPASPPSGSDPKVPTWLYGLELKCRKGGEQDFTDKTPKFGMEVFRDENNGNLVYIAHTGAIAVIPGGATPPPKEAKGPKWLHGLEFRVRKAGEADFTKDTKNYGAEIFKDENTGNLVYITETGSVAVIAAGTAAGGQSKAPKWMHGFELKVRKAGEADFTKDTKKYGGETFKDENTGNTVFICETGALAVTAGK